MKMTGTGEGEANDEKYYENKEGGQGSPFCKLSNKSALSLQSSTICLKM